MNKDFSFWDDKMFHFYLQEKKEEENVNLENNKNLLIFLLISLLNI